MVCHRANMSYNLRHITTYIGRCHYNLDQASYYHHNATTFLLVCLAYLQLRYGFECYSRWHQCSLDSTHNHDALSVVINYLICLYFRWSMASIMLQYIEEGFCLYIDCCSLLCYYTNIYKLFVLISLLNTWIRGVINEANLHTIEVGVQETNIFSCAPTSPRV
jgi:hypothetical protein